MHALKLHLIVATESKEMVATKPDIATKAEVIQLITNFLIEFAEPDHGAQEIHITLRSWPDSIH